MGRGAAAEEEEETLTASFVAVTAATRDEARFFLESHAWQLDPAIASFFDDQPQELPEGNENDEDDDVGGEDEEDEEDEEEVRGGGRRRKGGSEDEDYVPSDKEDVAGGERKGGSGSAGSRRKRKAGEPSGRSSVAAARKARDPYADARIGRDPRAEPLSDPDDDSGSGSGSGSGFLSGSSDEDTGSDEDQDYYAGGEERGSSRKRRRTDVQVRWSFRATPSKSKSNSFTGKGRLLTSEETPSSSAQQTDSPAYIVYLWRNGFSVNDGPLRGFDDPQNADFLESVQKLQCPEELKSSGRSAKIRVIRRNTVYSTQASGSPHKRSMRKGAFRGTGRTLGTEPEQVPDAIANVSVPAPTPASNDIPGFRVDESLPTTSLQIRLLDGTRLVARFNTSNTIRDLRAFIDASSPSGTSPVGLYQLQTVGFPPKPLNDESKTIEEEGIANSVVIQKA